MKNCTLLLATATLVLVLGRAHGQSKGCADGKSWSKNDWDCHDQPHTMCLYDINDGPGPACTGVKVVGLSQEERDAILKEHNRIRHKVASGKEEDGNPGPQPAGIIPPLKWSNELEIIAQTWVNQCQTQHDACRNTDEYTVSQNIAMQYDSPIKQAVTLWGLEVMGFDPANIKPFVAGESYGHYANVVWGETREVGCGYIQYDDGTMGGDGFQLIACNYGPGGFVNGGTMYETLE